MRLPLVNNISTMRHLHRESQIYTWKKKRTTFYLEWWELRCSWRGTEPAESGLWPLQSGCPTWRIFHSTTLIEYLSIKFCPFCIANSVLKWTNLPGHNVSTFNRVYLFYLARSITIPCEQWHRNIRFEVYRKKHLIRCNMYIN